jgi:molybdopterin molybdotransferase
MTGAMVPHSTARVVPFEICRESGAAVRVPSEALDEPQQFIRRRGSVAREGVELVAPGTRLQPDHLMMLAESGSRQVPVFRRPSVAVVCTGSELVEPGSAIRPGRKISGNGVLLSSLLRSGGAVCHGVVTVEDRVNAVLSVLEKLLENDVDLIITTGGMGPGKFDLMEQVFARLGGELVYNRLRVRPGKSTLFGLVEGKPFFALPGPPPAVRILFHELVGPAVARLQGMRDDGGLAEAVLRGSVPMQQKGYPCLKGGVARLVCGRLQVRKADQMESVNAVIHFGTQRCGAGDTVRVRLVGPLS